MTHTERLLTVLLLSCSLGGPACAKAAPQHQFNLECVTRLRVPPYPHIARAALVSLSFTAAMTLSHSGSIQSIAFEDISGPNPDRVAYFRPEVESALKTSTFAPACGGTTVRFVFSFQLDGGTPSVWFEPPNRFEVREERPTIVGARHD